jgi:hypothetical protein
MTEEASATTLYALADAEMRECIKAYLTLAEVSKGLADLRPEHLEEQRARVILLAGLGAGATDLDAAKAYEEWKRRRAVSFDIETGVSFSVYENMRARGAALLEQLEKSTKNSLNSTRFSSRNGRISCRFFSTSQAHLVRPG